MSDVFTGPVDPRDVRVTLLGLWPTDGYAWTARVAIRDGTDAEGCEIDCPVSGTLASIHPLDAQSIEGALWRHFDLIRPPERRLAVVRARVESGGEYAIVSNAEGGARIIEPPIRAAA